MYPKHWPVHLYENGTPMDMADVDFPPFAIGDGFIGAGGRYRVVDVWHSFTDHSTPERGTHVFLDSVADDTTFDEQ